MYAERGVSKTLLVFHPKNLLYAPFQWDPSGCVPPLSLPSQGWGRCLTSSSRYSSARRPSPPQCLRWNLKKLTVDRATFTFTRHFHGPVNSGDLYGLAYTSCCDNSKYRREREKSGRRIKEVRQSWITWIKNSSSTVHIFSGNTFTSVLRMASRISTNLTSSLVF
jgi:hypothetical protein